MKFSKICACNYLVGITIIVMFFSSCNKDVIRDYHVWVTYKYVNRTPYEIEMDVFNDVKELLKKYTIQALDTLVFTLDGFGGAGPFQYISELNDQGEYVYVTFSDMRYLNFSKNSGSNIFWEREYILTVISDTQHEMVYIFTIEDYQNARDIE